MTDEHGQPQPLQQAQAQVQETQPYGQPGYAPPQPPGHAQPQHPGYAQPQPPAYAQPAYPQPPQPYAQPGYPPQPYAQPGAVAAYAVAVYPVAPPEPKGLSVASLVLGLVSLFAGFTFVVPLVGFILGIVGLRREPAGRGMAIAGIVISALILLVWVVIIGFILFAGILAAGSAATYRTA